MQKLHLKSGIIVGVLLSASLTAIMFLGYQLADLPYVPYDFFDWMTRVLPGSVVTFGIDLMIDIMLWLGMNVANSAKTAEQIIAIFQFFIGGTLAGIIFFVVLSIRKTTSDYIAGIVMAALFGLPMITISAAISQSTVHPLVRILWLAILFSAWGLVLSWSFRRVSSITDIKVKAPEDAVRDVKRIDRRRFMIQIGTASATITVIGAGVGEILNLNKKRKLDKALMDSMAHEAEESTGMSFPNQNDPVMPAPGTRPEYTPVKDHYKVFIRTKPTVIDGSTWKLLISGMVENSLMLTLDDLKNNYTPFEQYVTITCISGRVGTGLIGTTLWTGARLKDILADAKIKPGAKYLYIIGSGSKGRPYYALLCLGRPRPPPRSWLPAPYLDTRPLWYETTEMDNQYWSYR